MVSVKDIEDNTGN